jgi:hypothetical protein
MIWPATNLSAETVGMKMGTPSHYYLDAHAEMCTPWQGVRKTILPAKECPLLFFCCAKKTPLSHATMGAP